MVNLITPILLPQGFSCHALMVVLCALLVIVQYLFPTIRAGDARWKSVKKALQQQVVIKLFATVPPPGSSAQ